MISMKILNFFSNPKKENPKPQDVSSPPPAEDENKKPASDNGIQEDPGVSHSEEKLRQAEQAQAELIQRTQRLMEFIHYRNREKFELQDKLRDKETEIDAIKCAESVREQHMGHLKKLLEEQTAKHAQLQEILQQEKSTASMQRRHHESVIEEMQNEMEALRKLKDTIEEKERGYETTLGQEIQAREEAKNKAFQLESRNHQLAQELDGLKQLQQSLEKDTSHLGTLLNQEREQWREKRHAYEVEMQDMRREIEDLKTSNRDFEFEGQRLKSHLEHERDRHRLRLGEVEERLTLVRGEFERTLKTLNEQREIFQNEKIRLEQKQKEAIAEMESWHGRAQTLEEEKSILEATKLDLEEQLRQRSGEILKRHETFEQSAHSLKEMEDRLHFLEEDLEKARNQSAEWETQKLHFEQEYAEQQQRWEQKQKQWQEAELREEAKMQALEEQTQSLNHLLAQANEQIREKENSEQALQEAVVSFNNVKEELQKSVRELEARLEIEKIKYWDSQEKLSLVLEQKTADEAKYLAIKNRMRDFQAQVQEWKQNYKNLESMLTFERTRREHAEEQLKSHEKEISELRHVLEATEKSKQELEAEYRQLQESRIEDHPHYGSLEQQHAELVREQAMLREELEALAGEKAEWFEERAQLNRNIHELNRKLEELSTFNYFEEEKKKRQLYDEWSKQQMEEAAKLQKSDEAMRVFEARETQLQNTLKSLQNELEEHRSKNQELQEAVSQQASVRDSLGDELQGQLVELESLRKSYQEAEARIAELEKLLESERGLNDDTNEKTTVLQNQVRQLVERLEQQSREIETRQSAEWGERLKDADLQILQLEKEKAELMREMESQVMEIQLRKDRETELRRSLAEAESKYTSLQTTQAGETDALRRLAGECENLKSQLESEKSERSHFEESLEQARLVFVNKVTQLADEVNFWKQRSEEVARPVGISPELEALMKYNVTQQERETELWKKKFVELEQENQKISADYKEQKHLQEEEVRLRGRIEEEIERLKGQLRDKEDALRQLEDNFFKGREIFIDRLSESTEEIEMWKQRVDELSERTMTLEKVQARLVQDLEDEMKQSRHWKAQASEFSQIISILKSGPEKKEGPIEFNYPPES